MPVRPRDDRMARDVECREGSALGVSGVLGEGRHFTRAKSNNLSKKDRRRRKRPSEGAREGLIKIWAVWERCLE